MEEAEAALATAWPAAPRKDYRLCTTVRISPKPLDRGNVKRSHRVRWQRFFQTPNLEIVYMKLAVPSVENHMTGWGVYPVRVVAKFDGYERVLYPSSRISCWKPIALPHRLGVGLGGTDQNHSTLEKRVRNLSAVHMLGIAGPTILPVLLRRQRIASAS